jgi:putative membrane protein
MLENVLPLSILALLAGMYRRWHLSDASYLCVALFLALHAVGAHYGYADVPLGGWLRDRLAGGAWGARNPYDRVVHFAFGLCWLYPTREALLYHVHHRRAALLFAAAAVLGASAVYEILEWGAALLVAPDTAAHFLGAQGDPWDAQQDMALAGARSGGRGGGDGAALGGAQRAEGGGRAGRGAGAPRARGAARRGAAAAVRGGEDGHPDSDSGSHRDSD